MLLASAASTVGVDQGTKYCILARDACAVPLFALLQGRDAISINTRGVFSLDIQSWFLFFACSALVALPFLFQKKSKVWWGMYGMLIGGALSNEWDRWRYGGVVDWIPMGISVANIADIAIVASLIFFVVAVGNRRERG